MLKVRWSHDRLIFNIGISIPGKDDIYTRRVTHSRILGENAYLAEKYKVYLVMFTEYVDGKCPFRCFLLIDMYWRVLLIGYRYVWVEPICLYPIRNDP